MENTLFTVNHYASLDAHSHTGTLNYTFSELVDYLSYSTISDNKYEGGLFLIGEMSDTHRINDHIINKHGLAIDYDELPEGFDLVQQIKDTLGFSWICFSTHNHTAHKPRLRLVIPLSSPLHNDYYKHAIDVIDEALGVKSDPSSVKLSQVQARQVLKTASSDRVFEYNETHLLDTTKLVEMIKQRQLKYKPLTASTGKRNSEHWSIARGHIAEGEGRNEALASLTGLLLRRYVPLDVTIQLLEHWNASNQPPLSEKEFVTTVKSIIKIETKRRGSEVL
ncbi:primase alpha helix C-terminal domain-containing protein [Macrococcus hajekii]|nr:primase alpha helix C-terminal domain-containing protein [Macrococcus hajekii]